MKKRKFRRGGGVNAFGIPRAWGVMHFGISEGMGGLKYGSRPWLGMDIFWNCPNLLVLKHVSKAHDILRIVHDNRKQVVGLIYTRQLVY